MNPFRWYIRSDLPLWIVIAVLLTVLLCGRAMAQSVVVPIPAAAKYQGTIATGVATSVSLITANVTMASSTVLPTKFRALNIINVGANPGYVCIFGGTASASSGCTLVAVGAYIKINPDEFATAPTFFSTAGTTFAFWG